jgi:CBS domain-containing protein
MVPIGELTAVREDESLLDALGDLQHGRLDRALVLDGEQVVGLLSISDIGRLVARHQR